MMRLDPSLKIEHNPNVYSPAEDSYLLIQGIEVSEGDSVLDMGCGCGIVALHCARMGAKVTAADISKAAIDCTSENAERNALNVATVMSDLWENVDGTFDLVVFNPPYLPEEGDDDLRWSGGKKGVETTLRFLDGGRMHLSPGGRILTIVSSLADQMLFEQTARHLGFKLKIIAEKKQFFEMLFLYELRPATRQ